MSEKMFISVIGVQMLFWEGSV